MSPSDINWLEKIIITKQWDHALILILDIMLFIFKDSWAYLFESDDLIIWDKL